MELLCDFLFMPSTPFFFYFFPPLHSVFLPVPFSPSLALSFLSFHPILVFSLLVPTSMSCHFLHSLSPDTPEFPLSLILPPGFFDSFSSFLLVLGLCPFHSAPQPSIFLLLLIFPLLHWHTSSSGTIFFPVFFFFSLCFLYRFIHICHIYPIQDFVTVNNLANSCDIITPDTM
jgi:hypothetical protein